jgi:ribose 5-phosphate isomerase A
MVADDLKRAAAAVAAELVETGMLVGLGTGSTATHAIRLLGEKFRSGLRFTGIATSRRSAELARSFGIPLIDSPTETPIDLTIDGADEISEDGLTLIKGMGGALLWEKIVAARSHRLVIVADESKLSPVLSGRVPVPIEVVTFGWESTKARLAALGCRPVLKRDAEGKPVRTDAGNLIFNCKFDTLPNPTRLEEDLSMIVGVVETGIFIGLATMALVASRSGVRRLDR